MTYLFHDDSLSELNSLSSEELLVKCIDAFESLDLKPLPQYGNDISSMKRELTIIKDKIKGNLQHLQLYLGEIYRRSLVYCVEIFKGINNFLEYKCVFCNDKKIEYHITKSHNSFLICSHCNSKYVGKSIYLKSMNCGDLISKILCDDDLTRKQRELYDNLYNITLPIHGTISIFKDKLQEIQMVKDTMIRIMKTPLLTKELETCMDEILDLNGNRISQLKEYLTEDQYRFVRSGAKFDELENQQDMLERMNKMLNQLKMTSIGESLLDLPIARPITPEIKHLENELIANKKRQKEHETQLKKLLGK
jgi:hypothetical protein